MKIGINGFGRIGRTFLKVNYFRGDHQIVGINDINPELKNMAYLLKYDSVFGKFPGVVEVDDKTLILDRQSIPYTSFKNVEDVPWERYNVDFVIDSSGIEGNVQQLHKMCQECFLDKAIVTHSSEIVDREVILGVNEHEIHDDDRLFSSSICDANAIAHVLKWIDEEFGLESGSITTLHPWLSYQNLVDGPAISQSNPTVVWNDYALGRSSLNSLIPKKTTAVSAVEKVLPSIKGKLLAFSYRTPTAIVASADMTLKLKKIPTQQEFIHYIEHQVIASPFVSANSESLVSLDYKQEEFSAICDMQWLQVKNGLAKVILWYDNEWGYSHRVLDLVNYLVKKDALVSV